MDDDTTPPRKLKPVKAPKTEAQKRRDRKLAKELRRMQGYHGRRARFVPGKGSS